MLQTALEYKDLFPRLKIRDPNFSCEPSDYDWMIAATIAEKLEVFYDATKLFSGRKYPTANCYFVQICKLRNALIKWVNDDDVFIKTMAEKMFAKYEKYWSTIHTVLAIAVVLDPRYKFKVIEYYYEQIFGDDSDIEIMNLKRICYELLNEYQSSIRQSVRTSAPSSVQLQGLSRHQ